MSQWPATQLSTESGRAPTADELLVNVKQLIEQFQSNSNPTSRVAFTDKTSQYTLIITSLSDMLSQFPTPSNNPTKKELDAAIPLAHHSLEAIERVSRRMEGALAGEEYALTSKLLVCLGTIEEWDQSNGVSFQASFELRECIIRVLTGLFALRVTETFTTEKKYEDGLSLIMNCLEEVFSAFNTAHASLTSTYPVTLTLFEHSTKISKKAELEGVDSKTIQLVSVHHARGFCLTLLQIVLSFLRTSNTGPFFFENVTRQAIEHTNLLFDSFLKFSDNRIHECFARLLSSTLSLAQISPHRATILQPQIFRFLNIRIDIAEDPDWEAADEKLVEVLNVLTKDTSLAAEPIDNICGFVSDWLSSADTALKSAVIIYLKYYLRQCPLSSLEALNSRIDQMPLSSSLDNLRLIITQRLGDRMIIDVSDATEDDWESLTVETVRSGFGLPIDASSSHLDISDNRWQAILIRELNNSLSEGLPDTSTEARLRLAKNLTALPDQLLPPSDRQKGKHSPIPLLPLFVLASNKLLEGPPNQVTPDVWRATLKALTECLNKHQVSDENFSSSEISIEVVLKTLHPGLTHANRSVRLTAGRATVKLFEICQENSDYSSTNMISGSLVGNLRHKSTRVRESALVTLGDLGSVAVKSFLGDVCFYLTCVLGDVNPILRGVAFLQLSRLAQRHKSPWNMVSPEVARLSRHIAANCVKQPLLLSEFCRFISYSPSSFLSQTSQYFLPDLIIKCAYEELGAISRILETTVATLIVEKPAEILEQVFMLKSVAQTEKALDFIVQNLQSVNMTSQRSLGISNLAKIALLPLLGKLVIQLGDEVTRTRELAFNAIQRVEKHLSDSRSSGKKPTPSMLPHVFLRSHVLGVVSYLNSELLDVHGKRSLEVKRKVLRGIKEMIHIIGDSIAVASPQLVAIMQNTIHQQGLSMPTIQAWHALASVLPPSDFLPYLALTSAIFVKSWSSFDYESKLEAKQTLLHIVNSGRDFGAHLNVMASFSDIPELQGIQERVEACIPDADIRQNIERICPRIADINPAVSQLAILEVKKLVSDQELFQPLISGDTFDPCIGDLVKVLHNVANREGEAYEAARLATFECLGIIGAADPDRFELPRDPEDPVLMFADLAEEKPSQLFAIHLITNVLTPIFPRTSDIKFQSQLAYTIQELLSFCGFTASLLSQEPENSISVKTRARWKGLPDDVRATVAPLLSSKFTVEGSVESTNAHPIYPSTSTYREWIQKFSAYLIANTSGSNAQRIFRPFHAILGSSDVQVLLFLLPNLVLHLLMGRSSESVDHIRQEIMCVLEDQVNPKTSHTNDMRLLCAQTIFQLMDHLNKYLRYLGVQMAQGRHRRHHKGEPLADRHKTAELLTTSIDHSLMAHAALQCKQHARALMSLEQRVAKMRHAEQVDEAMLQQDYEKMHEIYAHLDEPDGMNGISALVLSPSLEHQIREHESTGRWTSAQSCWEVSLQQDPNSLDSHIGLLRCLRNLGHFDTLRTHLTGVLARNPSWAAALEPFRLTGAWTARDWGTVEEIVNASQNASPELSTGKLLLALRTRNRQIVDDALGRAYFEFGQPVGAGGAQSYRRTYDANIHLHMVQDLSLIYECMDRISRPEVRPSRKAIAKQVSQLAKLLDVRYDAVLPSYRTLEPILSIRRTAFDLLNQDNYTAVNLLVGDYWLNSSKIARKAGHFQAAYSALLQGRHRGTPYHFIQGCKLLKSGGDSIRALQELNNALVLAHNGNSDDVIDLTASDEERRMKAKAFLLRARWMQASERFSRAELNARFNYVTQLYEGWETSFFYWALYLDRSQTHKDVPTTQFEEYINQNDHVVRHYGRSLKYGSKHLYQTVPRMLTLWLNMGQREELRAQRNGTEHNVAISKYGRLCEWIREDLVENVDPFKWLTAFPQIVSRLVNPNKVVIKTLYTIVGKVIQEYAQQSLWIICGVASSAKKERREAAVQAMGFSVTEKFVLSGGNAERKEVLSAVLNRVRPLTKKYLALNKELLHLCNFDVEQTSPHFLEVKCPGLANMSFSDVIVPFQDSFTTKIPPLSATILQHQAFPHSLPTIKSFLPHIHVMPSLQKPRKIGIEASNGQEYFFLCKPKDDLRKDARLMDFNSVVNKLLRANSDSRRRQLHIRTYSVVPLNEECGLIEWVRNTIPLRSVLKAYYDAKGIQLMPKKVMDHFDKLKNSTPEQAAKIFEAKVLPEYVPPVFHEWLLETFPEPSAWFASRLAYSRTAAVISMVGYIIGLGDRHCENIMLDEVTGETVHCDFNCLFDKGKQFDVPEVVPFRLTQNIVDGMGITGVEGCFRISCEITMQLLRSNQDCLMSVLEAFVHDPLVEWEKEKRVIGPLELKKHALGALNPIEKKLRGIESDRQVSVSNQVEKLIQAATSMQKLAKMYVGWNPWI